MVVRGWKGRVGGVGVVEGKKIKTTDECVIHPPDFFFFIIISFLFFVLSPRSFLSFRLYFFVYFFSFFTSVNIVIHVGMYVRTCIREIEQIPFFSLPLLQKIKKKMKKRRDSRRKCKEWKREIDGFSLILLAIE